MTSPRVSASVTFVRNLGNFQSVRVELGVERDVPEDKTYLEALSILKKEVEKAVEDAVQEIDKEAGKVNTVYNHKGH